LQSSARKVAHAGLKGLKNMNLIHFHPIRIENLKKSNILVNIRFVAKTSDIRNFSQNIRSDVETSEVATLVVLLELNVICGQRWIQFELQNNLSRDFAIDGKIYTTI